MHNLAICYLMSNIPKWNLASSCHLLKKLISLHGGLWRYTDILVCNLKHAEVGWSTPVICHKNVRYHDGVTLYFSMKFPSVAPKKTGNGYFSYMSADFRFLKEKQPKKRGKPWLNARKHWESKSINRNLSAAVLHVKPSCNIRNLNSGSYHFLVTGTKIF